MGVIPRDDGFCEPLRGTPFFVKTVNKQKKPARTTGTKPAAKKTPRAFAHFDRTLRSEHQQVSDADIESGMVELKTPPPPAEALPKVTTWRSEDSENGEEVPTAIISEDHAERLAVFARRYRVTVPVVAMTCANLGSRLLSDQRYAELARVERGAFLEIVMAGPEGRHFRRVSCLPDMHSDGLAKKLSEVLCRSEEVCRGLLISIAIPLLTNRDVMAKMAGDPLESCLRSHAFDAWCDLESREIDELLKYSDSGLDEAVSKDAAMIRTSAGGAR